MLRNYIIFNFCLLTCLKIHAVHADEKAWIEKALSGEIGLEQPLYDDTALNLAVRALDYYEEEAFKLLEKGAEVNVAGSYKETPLMRAATRSLELTKKLLWLGADPNMANESSVFARPFTIRQTPLYLAAMANRPDIVQVLIEYGADITFKKYNQCLLHDLCFSKRIAMLEFLLFHGVQNNIPKKEWAQYVAPVQKILKKMKKATICHSTKNEGGIFEVHLRNYHERRAAERSINYSHAVDPRLPATND